MLNRSIIKLTLMLCFLCLIAGMQSFAQGLIIEKTDSGAWVKDHGQNVLFYQTCTKSLHGRYPRANYIHPLFGADGTILTEDFPADHLHHRGIFWTWHQILIGDQEMGDAWECRDFIWDVQEVKQLAESESELSFVANTFWKSPLWKDEDGELKAFVEENTTVTVHSSVDTYRLIDFEISLLALEPNLKIGGSKDDKGYNGFSVRMRLPEDIAFASEDGLVEPKVGPVQAGPWMDISGSLSADGSRAGIVIMCHPDNPVYPDPWIIRKKGSMQNPAFPGREPVAISEKEPTRLKYRLVVYQGDLKQEVISELMQGWK